jgi:hypothetical protein
MIAENALTRAGDMAEQLAAIPEGRKPRNWRFMTRYSSSVREGFVDIQNLHGLTTL